ncbi:hypothetical protein [Campylobacter sp. RM12651]|uniref:hypothetical protein n=1 Tax=Campylobacter sp. RM12651 TaxID=1660079 RepID=UPI001EFA3159|nr:hypothetical protein [Campylobacter sp. RM12651]ULO04519.1 hypothetical protein AVBRAN_a0037 [Campylobacter sp. RM12651]
METSLRKLKTLIREVSLLKKIPQKTIIKTLKISKNLSHMNKENINNSILFLQDIQEIEKLIKTKKCLLDKYCQLVLKQSQDPIQIKLITKKIKEVKRKEEKLNKIIEKINPLIPLI